MWHSRDLASVLVACWCLDDEERRDALLDKRRALDAAILTNFAFADAKALDAERRAFDAELDEDPGEADVTDAVIAAAHAHLAELHAASR